MKRIERENLVQMADRLVEDEIRDLNIYDKFLREDKKISEKYPGGCDHVAVTNMWIDKYRSRRKKQKINEVLTASYNHYDKSQIRRLWKAYLDLDDKYYEDKDVEDTFELLKQGLSEGDAQLMYDLLIDDSGSFYRAYKRTIGQQYLDDKRTIHYKGQVIRHPGYYMDHRGKHIKSVPGYARKLKIPVRQLVDIILGNKDLTFSPGRSMIVGMEWWIGLNLAEIQEKYNEARKKLEECK